MNTTLKILLAVGGTLAFIALSLYGVLQYRDATVVEFESISVSRGVIENTLSIEGVVSAEKREALFSQTGDRVREIRFALGEEVNKDEVLIVFENGQELVAPFDGTIIKVDTYEGERIVPASQEPLMIIADLNSRMFTGEVEEDDISEIEEGQQVTFTCDIERDERLVGELKQIGQATQKRIDGTMFFEMTASIDSLGDFTERDAFSCDAEVITASRRNVVIAPFDSVTIKDGRPVVYEVREDGTTQEKEITTGLEGLDGFEVTRGLADGDVIARDAQVFEEN